MIPHKFYPQYQLVQLYYQTGELLKGNQMARSILSMPVKKMSPEVAKIKTISSDANTLIEMINYDTKKGQLVNENLITRIERDLFQIDTLADTINEKLSNNDYVELDNLFFYYNKI